MFKRIFTFVLALALLLSISSSFKFESSAASTVTIGHASTSDGNSNKGDGSGKEVCTRSWYCSSSKPWQYVIRPNSSSVAEKIAKTMEQACSNNKIGYSQDRRTTLYTQAKANNWNLSSITTKCDADCSSLVAVCVNAAGISVSKSMYTGNELSLLKETGKFTVYTSSNYTKTSDYLMRGDILLYRYNGSGHTAVVLSNGSKVTTNPTTPTSGSYFPACSSSYTSIVDALKSIGVDSSYTYRKKIAVANGISNYSGTASQNSSMLKLLKAGKLIKP